MTRHDAVVVGGGAAGLAAALWLARYRRDVVLLDSGDYRAVRVERSHGYLGRDPQAPMELLERGREELGRYPTASCRPGLVVGVGGCTGDFTVRLEDGSRLGARRLVLATGVEDTLPDVDGLVEHYGGSVFHCPACDGYEVRDRDVVALGWDPHLAGFAATLLNWARSVTVVTAGRRFRGDGGCRALMDRHGIEVLTEPATGFVGPRGNLAGVRLADGRVVPATLVFFSVAHRPRVELARSLGCRIDDDGYVAVTTAA